MQFGTRLSTQLCITRPLCCQAKELDVVNSPQERLKQVAALNLIRDQRRSYSHRTENHNNFHCPFACSLCWATSPEWRSSIIPEMPKKNSYIIEKDRRTRSDFSVSHKMFTDTALSPATQILNKRFFSSHGCLLAIDYLLILLLCEVTTPNKFARHVLDSECVSLWFWSIFILNHRSLSPIPISIHTHTRASIVRIRFFFF